MTKDKTYKVTAENPRGFGYSGIFNTLNTQEVYYKARDEDEVRVKFRRDNNPENTRLEIRAIKEITIRD